GVNRFAEFHFFVSQMGNRALAEVFNREPEDHVHNQHVIYDYILVSKALRILSIEVNRVEIHGYAREKAVVSCRDRAAPMMLKQVANLEIFEVVATFDFAHCHKSGRLVCCSTAGSHARKQLYGPNGYLKRQQPQGIEYSGHFP